ncbi:allene oxide cyclase barrel-like domain-containing protein [Streptomyces sp. NPDC005148]
MRHFKHVGLSAAMGLTALLACSQPAWAFSSTGAVSMQATQLIARQTQMSFIDADGSSGPSQGDEIVVSGDLLRNSVPVGNYGEVCTMTRTAPADEFDLQCAGSLLLAEGDIAFQGRFTVTAAGPGDDIKFAITGGTGDYREATGYIQAVNVSATDTQFTLQLGH